MTKAVDFKVPPCTCPTCRAAKLAASEGLALVSDARTDDPTGVPMSGGAEPAGAANHSRPYFVDPRAHKFAFKPYDWRAAKRDRHVCHNVSHRLSAATRRLRDQRSA